MTGVIAPCARPGGFALSQGSSRVALRLAHKKSAAPGETETTQSAHAASRYLKISSGPCRLSGRNEVNGAAHAAVQRPISGTKYIERAARPFKRSALALLIPAGARKNPCWPYQNSLFARVSRPSLTL